MAGGWPLYGVLRLNHKVNSPLLTYSPLQTHRLLSQIITLLITLIITLLITLLLNLLITLLLTLFLTKF